MPMSIIFSMASMSAFGGTDILIRSSYVSAVIRLSKVSRVRLVVARPAIFTSAKRSSRSTLSWSRISLKASRPRLLKEIIGERVTRIINASHQASFEQLVDSHLHEPGDFVCIDGRGHGNSQDWQLDCRVLSASGTSAVLFM